MGFRSGSLFSVFLFMLLPAVIAWGDEPPKPSQVKVAAVQMLGYDKTDLPRPGYDPSEAVVPYIERAAKDGAQLVVFPEYLLGRITVPGPQTERIAKAAAAGKIYVIVGCWEVFEDGTFANTALLFDRSGKIAGKYRKVHAAVDNHEGEPPWSKPPQGKDDDWFLTNDPEWKMQRGDDFPVFDLDFGRIGILTCYDGWFPETHRILSLRGAEILVWINGRRGTVEDFIVKSAMFQDEVAMVATNQAYGCGDDDRPVARPDPRRLHRAEGGLHHRHDRSGQGPQWPGRTAGTSSSDGPRLTGRS